MNEKYGVFKKGDWKCLVLFTSEEQAQACIKGKEHLLEVREVISDDGSND